MSRINPLYPLIPNSFFSIFTEIAKAWQRGGKTTRRIFIGATVFLMVAGILAGLREIRVLPAELLGIVAGAFGIIGGALLIGLVVYQRALDETELHEKIRDVEEEAKEHPDKPRAAWELARLKLESYLNRNLAHVRWIFILILIIMGFGFIIIAYGVYRVYESPESLRPSIVVACSGVLIEFIGATFLIIYRSTMMQAQAYVGVLERINAVGMSLQILEGIEEVDPQLKNKARAELAKELLTLYGKTG